MTPSLGALSSLWSSSMERGGQAVSSLHSQLCGRKGGAGRGQRGTTAAFRSPLKLQHCVCHRLPRQVGSLPLAQLGKLCIKNVCQLLSCVQLFTIPWTIDHQAPLSVKFSWQEHWSGLPFPSTRIKPWSPASQADILPSEPVYTR